MQFDVKFVRGVASCPVGKSSFSRIRHGVLHPGHLVLGLLRRVGHYADHSAGAAAKRVDGAQELLCRKGLQILNRLLRFAPNLFNEGLATFVLRVARNRFVFAVDFALKKGRFAGRLGSFGEENVLNYILPRLIEPQRCGC